MNKTLKIVSVLLLGLPVQTFAKSGIGSDSLQFVLALSGFLLLLAGVMKGIDWFTKNGKGLLQQVGAFLKRQYDTFRGRFNRVSEKYSPV